MSDLTKHEAFAIAEFIDMNIFTAGYAMFCKANCSLGGQGIKKPDDYCSYGEMQTEESE